MALYVLFCIDLMANVENCIVRVFTFFPKHVTFTPLYGQSVLGNTLMKCFTTAIDLTVYALIYILSNVNLFATFL